MEQPDLPTSTDEFIDDYEEPTAFDRFVQVFTRPSEAFAGLERSERRGSIIGWGIAISFVVAVAAVVIVMSLVGTSPRAEQQMEKAREQIAEKYKAGEMSPEQYKMTTEQFEMMAGSQGQIVMTTIVTALRAVWWLLAALIVWGISRALERDSEQEVSYSTALSVYMIALMVPNLMTILYMGLAIVMGNFDMMLGPMAMVPLEDANLTAMLSLIDPFNIWWMVVVGIGISTVARIPRRKAVTAFIIVWGVINIGFLLATMGLQSLVSV